MTLKEIGRKITQAFRLAGRKITQAFRLAKATDEKVSGQYAENFANMAGNRSMEIECAKDYTDNTKTIDVRLVVHARWKKGLFADITCSNCDFSMCIANSVISKMFYCPNCGARMDAEKVFYENERQKNIGGKAAGEKI